MRELSRRHFVTIGALATATGLAGCTEDDEIDDEELEDDPENGVGVDDEPADEEDDVDDEPDDEEEVDDEPDDEEEDDTDEEPGDDAEERVDSYLTENDAQQYDGTIEDHTDEDEVVIANGAGDEGFAFDPVALRIDTGTTIVWEWTGEGGSHNVVPDGDTDFDDFGDDEIVDEEGHTVEDTFDEEGVGLYVCEPHAGVGMYGAFIVE